MSQLKIEDVKNWLFEEPFFIFKQSKENGGKQFRVYLGITMFVITKKNKKILKTRDINRAVEKYNLI